MLRTRRRASLPGLAVYLAAALCVSAYARLTCAAPLEGEEAITFTANSGESTEAYAGSLQVPEYRADRDSRTITLRYVRFPSTSDSPGAPIVYLAGGPGGSGIGTAKWRRFPLFVAMRAHGDVIALDQRGTGASDQPPECHASELAPGSEYVSDDEFAARHRAATRECEQFWTEAGTDLRGYTTQESVEDLSDLRKHLGAETLNLWGISYGSHLALAAMKSIPDELDRVIIASVEGLDQTVKLPSRTDDYFQRLAAAAGKDDLVPTMQKVLERLDAKPEPVTLQMKGVEVPYLLHRRDLQIITSAAIADPRWAFKMIEVYEAAHGGDYGPASELLAQFVYPNQPIVLRAMPTAMDRASGISDARLARVTREAETGLLGSYLNFPMPHVLSELEHLDLGSDFRTKTVSDIPTLVLSGSLDGRTYPASQREATSGLSEATYVTVEGAGHNLFMASPDVANVMSGFLTGEAVTIKTIMAD